MKTKQNHGKREKKEENVTLTSVYHLIVLDESGSMHHVRKQTVDGCNETIQTIRTMQKDNQGTQRHDVSIYLFASGNKRYIIQNEPIETVKEITCEDYCPNGGTPLFDAVGQALTDLKQILMQQKDAMGYVTIITDGMENASHKYRLEDVKSLIEELKQMNVIFTFVGANIDAAGYGKMPTPCSLNRAMKETAVCGKKNAEAEFGQMPDSMLI